MTAASLQKYSELRANLAEDNSESDEQNNQVTHTLYELLPLYYQYRKYLLEMLKQTNFNFRSNSNLVIPQQYLQEKIKKWEEEKQLYEEKLSKNLTSRVSRLLITEKTLQRKRKKLKEEMELQRKYEAQQIQALISRQGSNKRMEEQPTFEHKNYRQQNTYKNRENSSGKLLWDLDPNIEEDRQVLQNQEQFQGEEQARPNKKRRNKEAQNSAKIGRKTHLLETGRFNKIMEVNNENQRQNNVNGLKEFQNKYSNSRPKPKQQGVVMFGNEQRVNNTNPPSDMPGSRNKKIKEDEKKDRKGRDLEKRLSSNSSVDSRDKSQWQDSVPPPKIRINYGKFPEKDSCSQENVRSQEDDFSDVGYSNPNNFEAQNDRQDETYSEQKARPYSRHNTPNFDTLSQKVTTNKFLEMQKQKLLSQQKFAEKIQAESSVADEDELVSISSKIEKVSELSLPLKDSQTILRKKISAGSIIQREVETQYFSSIRCMLSQICDLFSQAECYKYLLKHKQYQILKKLYDEQVGKGPIFGKSLAKKIQLILKDQQKSETNIIITQILGSQKFINFEDFGNVFSSGLFENEYSILNARMNPSNSTGIEELLSKLFSVWLQMNYFQSKIKKISQLNQNQIPSMIGKVTRLTDHTMLDYEELEKFLYSTCRNQSNKLKIKIFCSNYFPHSKFSELAGWLQAKSAIK